MDNGGKVNFRIRSAQSVQGIYTMAANGTAYGFLNERVPDDVVRLMDDALSQFRQFPPPRVELSKVEPVGILSKSPDPANTNVIRVFTRVRPIPLGANRLNQSLGRDHMWLFGSDLRAVLVGGASGNPFSMPASMKQRLVRFHLLDNVRGDPDVWEANEVRKADIRITPLGKRGETMVYTLSGNFAMRTASSARGFEGSIEGEFAIAVATARLHSFTALAEGTAWGDSKFTAHAPAGKYPLKIAMVHTDDAYAKTVPPKGLALGEKYFKP